MKKLFYSLAIIAAVTACNEEMKESDSPVNGEGKTFTAKFEGSKVYMGEDYYYRWQAGDLVSVFTDAYHDQYKAVTGDVTETDLEYVSTTAALGTTLDKSYAVYPYNAANALEDGVVYTEIAAEQTYSHNGLGNAIMVSETSGSEFVFKNACALVKVNLTIAEDFTNLHAVKSIRVSSKSKVISGAATINVAGGDYAAKMVTQTLTSESSVTLVGCQEAGMLQADKAITFYLAIPAGTYPAGDLVVEVLTDGGSAPFNPYYTLSKQHTVNRSQYLEVTATIAKGYTWFEEKGDEVVIKEDVVLQNKAIMCDSDNLKRQNFKGHDSYDKIFSIPSGDFNLTGEQLVAGGEAVDGPNGPTITFQTTDEHVFIVNTFTTTTSGLTATKAEDVNTVTVSNLTITGDVTTNTMGIYVDPRNWAPKGTYDQSKFHTVWNDVNVVDCNILPFNSIDKKLGAAVCVFGIAELNNCKLTGSKKSPYVDTHYADYANFGYYDMACTNSSHTYINGGEVGSIFGWEQSKFTIFGGAKIGTLKTIGISTSNLGPVVIKDATVNELIMDPSGTYKPMLTITADANIGTLRFLHEVAFDSSYWASVSIDANATIGEIYVGDTKYDLAGFLAYKAALK